MTQVCLELLRVPTAPDSRGREYVAEAVDGAPLSCHSLDCSFDFMRHVLPPVLFPVDSLKQIGQSVKGLADLPHKILVGLADSSFLATLPGDPDREAVRVFFEIRPLQIESR